jgi:hypothetical protein
MGMLPQALKKGFDGAWGLLVSGFFWCFFFGWLDVVGVFVSEGFWVFILFYFIYYGSFFASPFYVRYPLSSLFLAFIF